MSIKIELPRPDEYAAFYRGYIGHVESGDILQPLASQPQELASLLSGANEEQAGHRYAPGKWTVRQVVGHMNDAERLFAYRAFCFSRQDPGPLPGMDQDEYVSHAPFDAVPLADLVAEFDFQRRANLLMVRGLSPESLMRRGEASGFSFTVRALVYILAGHAAHHITGLRENYLNG